jgi:hypothetical protein
MGGREKNKDKEAGRRKVKIQRRQESKEPRTSEGKSKKTRENKKKPATRREEKQKRCPEHAITIFDFIAASRYVLPSFVCIFGCICYCSSEL